MKALLFVTVCLMCLLLDSSVPAFAQTQPATAVQGDSDSDGAKAKEAEIQKGMRNLGMSMSFFYKKPDAKVFEKINRVIDQNEETILKASKRNRFNVIAATFLARVHEKHKFPVTSQGQIGELARAILAKDKDNKDAAFVNDPKMITGSKLDSWWISFSATGDTKYVESILNVTGNPKTKKLNGQFDIPVVAAANWSFKSNCRLHKPVFEFAVKASKQDKWAAQKPFLEHCVESAKAKTSKDPAKTNEKSTTAKSKS